MSTTVKHPHYDKSALVYYWGKQLSVLAKLSGKTVNEVTNWIHRDYLTRESDQVHVSLARFSDHFLGDQK